MTAKSSIARFLVWLVLAGTFATLGIFTLDWPQYHQMAQRGVETTGLVTGKEPENHRFIRYSFRVNGEVHSGFGSAGGDNPEFENLKIGDQVKVFYDPSNPNRSFLGNPKTQAGSITLGVLFLSVVGSLMSMGALYAKGWLPGMKRG